jgi:hypothetical protein
MASHRPAGRGWHKTRAWAMLKASGGTWASRDGNAMNGRLIACGVGGWLLLVSGGAHADVAGPPPDCTVAEQSRYFEDCQSCYPGTLDGGTCEDALGDTSLTYVCHDDLDNAEVWCGDRKPSSEDDDDDDEGGCRVSAGVGGTSAAGLALVGLFATLALCRRRRGNPPRAGR